ncbi:hypothetical protein PYCC9005_000075 [Savitreella phatthalungensis]
MLILSLALLTNPTAALYINSSANVIAPCDSRIFCYGELLRDVQLARPFTDSKTFVDMPTTKPFDQVFAAYQNLTKPLRNDSQLQSFLSNNFGQAGTEIGEPNTTLSINPTYLGNVSSNVVADFVRQVMGIWPTLTRQYKSTGLCEGCTSSSIPLNHTFVVAGGRFREAYYWDSFWIMEGLLRTKGSYTSISKDILLNFFDLVRLYGFVPNGSRKYYLNRSQPPLLTQMVRIYIEQTNDTSILTDALPVLEAEQRFFSTNNSILVNITGGYSYNLSRYYVNNNQPRPESFVEDYAEANNVTYITTNGTAYQQTNLSSAQQASLYSQLAAGAESGWDYSGGRWLREPLLAANGRDFPLRTLNVEGTVPVDLNSIQYYNEATLAEFYDSVGNATAAAAWRLRAQNRKFAMEIVLYNATLGSFFDYNLTSRAQNTHIPSNNGSRIQFFSPAQFFPYWAGAVSDALLFNATALSRAFAPVQSQLSSFPGGLAATDLTTGQQWDAPNVWPPLQDIVVQAALRAADSISSLDSSSTATSKAAVRALPGPQARNETATQLRSLGLQVAQRYVDSAYCTWRSTGGSHPTLNISRLPGFDNATDASVRAANGTMFEKYSNLAIDAVGSGGEYTVVPGFGWSNGVLIAFSDLFAGNLTTPNCGDIRANTEGSSVTKRHLGHSEYYLAPRSAFPGSIKAMGRRMQGH